MLMQVAIMGHMKRHGGKNGLPLLINICQNQTQNKHRQKRKEIEMYDREHKGTRRDSRPRAVALAQGSIKKYPKEQFLSNRRKDQDRED